MIATENIELLDLAALWHAESGGVAGDLRQVTADGVEWMGSGNAFLKANKTVAPL